MSRSPDENHLREHGSGSHEEGFEMQGIILCLIIPIEYMA